MKSDLAAEYANALRCARSFSRFSVREEVKARQEPRKAAHHLSEAIRLRRDAKWMLEFARDRRRHLDAHRDALSILTGKAA